MPVEEGVGRSGKFGDTINSDSALRMTARRALIPLENKRNFLDVSGDIVERVDPVCFSDPMTAAMKGLGMM